MAKTRLGELLSKQSLILAYIKEKLEVLNFLNWAFENNLSQSEFIISVAHTYYRSIIVEVCTLFDNHKYQSNNFHLLISSKKKYSQELSNTAIQSIQEILETSEQLPIGSIIDLRNEEISHFKFGHVTKISFSLEFLPELNKLSALGEMIILTASKGFTEKEYSTHYIIDTHSSILESLQLLLQKASGFDFRSAYSLKL